MRYMFANESIHIRMRAREMHGPCVTKMAPQCDGWETLSHDVEESDLHIVGQHTKLCSECYARMMADPAKDQLMRYL